MPLDAHPGDGIPSWRTACGPWRGALIQNGTHRWHLGVFEYRVPARFFGLEPVAHALTMFFSYRRIDAMGKVSQTLPQGHHPQAFALSTALPFEHWRQTRSHPSERIPKRLWDQAAALAQVLPRSRVAQHLRLSPSDLDQHMATRPNVTLATPRTPTPFVEVPIGPACSPATTTMEIELDRPHGVRLRLRCSESAVPVADLVRTFLEGAR